MNQLFSLQGRTALITGGSRGIGRMIAEGFLKQGARVYISARKAAACDQTAAELSAFGTCVSLPADDTFPESGWDKVVDLNLKTPFFLTQALHGHLCKAGQSRVAKVINIASIDGVSVNPQETYSYAASKAGLIHLTRRMALHLVKDNIVVTAIAPGAFASDMNKDARDHATEVSARIPAGRIGTAEDMAGAAIYLASRAGDYVVGSTLVVDGGVTHARG